MRDTVNPALSPLTPFARHEIARQIAACDAEHDHVLNTEAHSPERAKKLRDIETRRTALADRIGAC